MEQYDRLYRVYEEFDADRLRAYQDVVDLYPPVDARVALAHWHRLERTLAAEKEAITEAVPEGAAYAEIAARASREQAFTALDLLGRYGRAVNVLVLDVDETLRSAGRTDNEIPRETLHLLTELAEDGLPIVICTGQTLENVKGFLVQGLGSELVHAGDLSIVYEAGTGVFTPGHGADTKQLLYEELDPGIVATFDRLRSRVLAEASDELRRGCHLQGNEFNVTVKPNHQVGSERAHELIDHGLVRQLDCVGAAVAEGVADGDWASEEAAACARAFYADADPEIRGVLDDLDALPGTDREGAPDLDREGAPHPDREAIPEPLADAFERIDVAYYEADAAEVGSRELDKPGGVAAALNVLGIEDSFALVVGDSKSDLRVMEWAAERDAGIAAAPEHASAAVLEHVRARDDLVFPRGRADVPLRIVAALDRLAA